MNVVPDRLETVVAADEERGLAGKLRVLDGLHQVANTVVAVACTPISLGRARPGAMLDVIHLHQVQQQQVGGMLLDRLGSHPRVEPIAHAAAGGLAAPAGLPIDGDAFPAQLGQPGLGGEAVPAIAEHVGSVPVDGRGIARGRPGNGGDFQPCRVGRIEYRGHLHRLVLVEHRVADQRDGLACGAIKITVAHHAGLGGGGPGDQGDVIRPGDGGENGDHSLGPRPFAGQAYGWWACRPRIVEVEVRKAVDGHQDHAAVGMRLSAGRLAPGDPHQAAHTKAANTNRTRENATSWRPPVLVRQFPRSRQRIAGTSSVVPSLTNSAGAKTALASASVRAALL